MTHLLRRPLALLPLLFLACLVGCSGQGGVSGTVTLDDQPLKEGTIRFVPADGKSQTAAATITDGKYSAPVPRGEMKVEISAPKATGKKIKAYDTPDSPVIEETVELLPDRYNVKTELKVTVKGGSQTENFSLKSK